MAATAFQLYNEAKKYLLTADLDLNGAILKAQLHKSTSNASTFTLSTLASVDVPVTGGGYAAKTLASVVVTTGASAKQIKFDAADLVWTATGSNIVSIMYLVIGASGGKALCWSKLTTAVFTLASPNTLTIQFNSAGIFTLT
jgi:hypothetical protein